jgi:4'-phosphopantetheinyl transferase
MASLSTTPLSFPKLKENEVHLWCVAVPPNSQQSIDRLGLLESFLSPQEKIRRAKYRFAHLQQRYLVAHGVLRELLGKYLSINPQSIVLSKNQFGKLYGENVGAIKFNLSHSRDLVLFAFTLKREIGVDIEYVRKNFAFAKIAKRFFSPQEANDLLALPRSQQRRAFFNCWVRKEAFLKALGVGLSHELDKFSVGMVDFDRGEDKVRVALQSHGYDTSAWMLYGLKFDLDYAAAVVVQSGVDVKLCRF